MKPKRYRIDETFLEKIEKALIENREIRKSLSPWGRVHIDRQLPFLCLYRKPSDREDVGTEKLAITEASYLIAPADLPGLDTLIERIAETATKIFGTFLLIEIWSEPAKTSAQKPEEPSPPRFTLCARKLGTLTPVMEILQDRLREIPWKRGTQKGIRVDLRYEEAFAPIGLSAIPDEAFCKEKGCYRIGIGVEAIYQNEEGTLLYPYELRKLRHALSKALKHALFSFTQAQTNICPAHHEVLGRRGITKVVWEVDRALAQIDNAFDFLLQVTPVNTNTAWERFREDKFAKEPEFLYRPRPFDPPLAKRDLFKIPIERIEDATLMDLFCEKRTELDRKLTMLDDRESPNFLYGSLQTYGGVEPKLLETAKEMLRIAKTQKRENAGADTVRGSVDALTFAKAAKAELAWYKKAYPQLEADVQIREDIVSGAMVSGRHFLISKYARFPKKRVEALINHEIGTHVLTYINGTTQPFMQLHTGLCGYDQMQEGIAVLSEYLCGGLTKARLKILAGRVVAVDSMVRQEGFVRTFERLCDECRFKEKTAFTVTTRVYRGGGLTKDAVYLRGLIGILEYLRAGGEIEPLFVGKIAASHIPLVEELQWRGILRKPPLFPRYLQEEGARRRLREIREKGVDILELMRRVSGSKP